MIDMEATVIQALETDPFLSGLVGDKVFRWSVPDKYANRYPYVRVAELDNTDNNYRDNQAGASDIDMQVDFWVKGDPSAIQTAINKVMRSLQFKRTGVTSFYEEDTRALRKVMRYRTKVKL